MKDNETQVELTTSETSSDQKAIDYKAEYEKAQAKLKKAEFTLYKTKKEEKVEKSKVFDDSDDNEPNVTETAQDAIEQIRATSVSSILDNLTSNEDEKELAFFHYNNSIRKTGDVSLDAQNALVLANSQSVLERQNRELKTALINKSGMTSNSVGSSSRETSTPISTYFSEAQIADLKGRGWSDEKIKTAEKNMQR